MTKCNVKRVAHSDKSDNYPQTVQLLSTLQSVLVFFSLFWFNYVVNKADHLAAKTRHISTRS